MERKTRTDIHRPAEMDPKEYLLIAFLEPDQIEDPETGNIVTETYLAVCERELWSQYDNHEIPHFAGTKNADPRFPHLCDHCGAHFKYAAWYLHLPTKEVITVGRTCSEKRFGSTDWENLANAARVRSHSENALNFLAEAAPELAEWFRSRTRLAPYVWKVSRFDDKPYLQFAEPTLYNDRWRFCLEAEYLYLNDILTGENPNVEPRSSTFKERGHLKTMRFHRERIAGAEASLYGLLRPLSEAILAKEDVEGMIALLIAGVDKVEGAISRMYTEVFGPKEELPVTTVPTGKQTVTGAIVSTKYQEDQFGGSLKMIVLDDRGFKVFGSVPSSLFGTELKGARVTFSATLEPGRETGFGFFKRPTKASFLEEFAEAV